MAFREGLFQASGQEDRRQLLLPLLCAYQLIAHSSPISPKGGRSHFISTTQQDTIKHGAARIWAERAPPSHVVEFVELWLQKK